MGETAQRPKPDLADAVTYVTTQSNPIMNSIMNSIVKSFAHDIRRSIATGFTLYIRIVRPNVPMMYQLFFSRSC